MATLQNDIDFDRPPANDILYRKYVQNELDEIRAEVDKTCAVTSDVEPVPESGYEETWTLLDQIPRVVPMPDLMWLEDGGIGLEWRPGNGIVTMSLYGDNHVTFVAVLGDQHEIAGTLPLSDTIVLPSFLTTLSKYSIDSTL